MTVAELIAKLQEMPGDAMVALSGEFDCALEEVSLSASERPVELCIEGKTHLTITVPAGTQLVWLL